MNQNNVVEQNPMAERATITIHTSPEVRQRLERLAQATRRTKSFLGNEAIEQYLAAEEEFVAGVQAGIEEANSGQVMSSDELRASLHSHVDQVGKRTE